MSLINRITTTTADIAQRLHAAEGQLAELQNEHAMAALEAETGEPGTAAKLVGVLERLQQARNTLENLQAAHKGAVARDTALDREKRQALQKAALKTCKFYLSERDRAAADLERAIDAAARAWKSVLANSARAEAANVAGGQWPPGALTQLGDIRRLVEGEMWRLGGDTAIGGRSSLPGANPPDANFTHNAEGVVPMTKQIRIATEHTLTVLSARVEK